MKTLGDFSQAFKTSVFSIVVVEETEKGYLLYVPAILKKAFEKKEKEIREVLKKPYEVKFVRKLPDLSSKGGEDEKPEVPSTGVLLGEPLSHEYLLGNFIVASCNKDAYDTVMRIAESSQAHSVVIYGPTGVGKSHLLQGVAWWRLFSSENVAFFPSSKLVSLISDMFSRGSGHADVFAENIARNAHWIMLDDLQMLMKPRLGAVREVLFNLVEAAISRRRKILVATDVNPDAWENIHSRLKQRLMLTAAVEMFPPSSDFAEAYVAQMLEREGIELEEEALSLVKNLPFVSVRDLKRLVFACVARGDKRVTKEKLIGCISTVMGVTFVSDEIKDLRSIWFRMLEEFLPPTTVQEVKAGSEGALTQQEKEILREMRIGFVKALSGKRKAVDIARAIGVGRTTYYRLLSADMSSVGKAVYARVKEMMEGGNVGGCGG